MRKLWGVLYGSEGLGADYQWCTEENRQRRAQTGWGFPVNDVPLAG